MRTSMTHYRKLFSDVEKHGARSVYLLHGSEGLIMERMARKIVGSIVPDDLRAFNLTVAYGSEMNPGLLREFVATARSFPFLTERRVLVLRELERLHGTWGPLVEYCRHPAPSSVVILLYHPYDEWKSRARAPKDYDSLAGAVEGAGAVMAFESLASEDLIAWVRQEAKRAGVTLEAGAAEALVRSVGDNLYDLQNEIAKLALLYEGASAGEKDLGSVIGGYRLNAVADLIESLAPGREREALAVLARIVESGAEEPTRIVYQLTRHFLGILKVAAGVGGGGYRYEQARRGAARFGGREALVWLENLRRGEIALKTSAFPDGMLLVGILMHSFAGTLMESPLAAA